MVTTHRQANRTKTWIIGLIITACLSSANAQVVSDSDAHAAVEALRIMLIEKYPFPELSQKYSDALLKNEESGIYRNLTEQEFADKLTSDLQQAHKDVHLHVIRDVEQYKHLTAPDSPAHDEPSDNRPLRSRNYGFADVDIDTYTSTAYINIPGPFYATQEAFETAAAAMNVAAFSNHFIMDLRNNPGGAGEMGRFLASYFFPAGDERFFVNGFFKDRSEDIQEWTYSYVPGRRHPTEPVYILVGPGTGSAAEGFAFGMQKLHRAIIVGETTAGAGIAGSFFPLKNNLVVFLPFKMVVEPHTQVGWEGTGVVPDVVTTGKDALTETKAMILRDLVKNSKDPEEKLCAEWLAEDAAVPTRGQPVWETQYAGLSGQYNNNVEVIATQNGFLWQTSVPGKPVRQYKIIEVKPDVLTIIDLNKAYGPYNTRIYVMRDSSGKILNLEKRLLTSGNSIFTVPQRYSHLGGKSQ